MIKFVERIFLNVDIFDLVFANDVSLIKYFDRVIALRRYFDSCNNLECREEHRSKKKKASRHEMEGE